jgi:hypothetical protein
MSILIAAAILATASPQAAVDKAVDSILRARGIEGLTEDQQVRVRRLVIDMLDRRSGSSEASESAERYLERAGYRKCTLALVRVEGEAWLVHSTTYGRQATKDLPFGLNALSFRSGTYFCKQSLVGGPTEFIDDDGDEQRLLFAKWITLR